MTDQGATIGCKPLRAALAIAKSAGVDVGALLARHRIAPADPSDPDARFPHAVWLEVWREIDARGEGAFGIRAAQALPEDHFDVIDYVMASSENMAAGLSLFERYFAILSTGVSHVVVPVGDGARLERRYAPGAHTTIGHPAEFAFANVLIRSRKMTGITWRPVEMYFAHKKPGDGREQREFFDCAIHWEAELSAMVFDRATLDLPMKRPAPELRRVLERHADAIVAALPKTAADLRARAKEAIVAGLRGNHSTLGEVAKKLGMSDRTLQRRLGEEHTSHAELVDEARAELAVRYLGEPTLAINEVAFLLGFNDVSAFHRAFRRWTNRTPADFRKTPHAPL